MKIAIVNDSKLALEALQRVVAQDKSHTVVWTAADGEEALACTRRSRPDIILMDLVMPVMNGVECTRRIMAESPCAILVVTATVDGHAPLVFEAMGWGALDAVATPVFGAGGRIEGQEALLAKIATIGKLIAPASSAQTRAALKQALAADRGLPLVVVGSSTGGPKALCGLLPGLKKFPGAVVVAQHIDADFAPGLARWLGEQTGMSVRLVEEGHVPQAGDVLIAGGPGDLAMTASRALTYLSGTADSPYHPDINVFFRSVARYWGGAGAAALLTGMGKNGADGLQALRKAGWLTLAQDEAGCTVYGMPKAAVENDAAGRVLPVEAMADPIVRYFRDAKPATGPADRQEPRP